MFFDIRYFKDLHDIVSVEPIRERDKVMMGMLASIGIEPGKPFDPQGKTKAAMEAAVVDAYHLLKERNIALYKSNAYWPDRHWAFTLITDPARGFEFVTDKAVLIDDRAQVFFMQTMNPKYVSEKPATVYLFAFEDASGRALEPGKTYRLRFPKDVPVGQFWSLIVYDDATGAFIYSPTDRVGLLSYDVPKMKRNDDGSVDLLLRGQRPTAGFEANWIPTEGKQPIPVLRLYGAQQAFWDKTFKLNDVELVE